MLRVLALMAAGIAAQAQVYSPKVLAQGQADASDLVRFADSIYAKYAAHTAREKAEAIWRFFLTDGRFVEPGFWYHIAGWAYEEPAGEVLDPLKLVNSYGFGLCYQIAPVLAATWKAGGFEDARVWFLTGHTVAEVFYDGAYHYFDSDMMGYNKLPDGSVASVRQIETDGSIITAQPAASRSDPWYPADVRAGAMGGLAELFTTTRDNWLFPFERAPQGHAMTFVLRPGESLVRYFQPEPDGRYYLPYKQVGHHWLEFPQEIAQYAIRTEDGPRSQKDNRRWATGRLEYRPPAAASNTVTHEVQSPYVMIDAEFRLSADLPSADDLVAVEISADDGRTWERAGTLRGPHHGEWCARPSVLTQSEHGRRTAVSGRYAYLFKLTRTPRASVRDLLLTTFVQLNPRTLPALMPGRNNLIYTAGPERTRHELAIDPAMACAAANGCRNFRYVSGASQGYWVPESAGPAEITFRIRARDAAPLAAIHAGARFLDLNAGLAPDKFTAEVRKVEPMRSTHAAASIAWSTSSAGPYRTIWTYDPRPKWLDAKPVDRVLRWPEVDRTVPANGATEIYVRYRVRDLAIDQFRIAYETGVSETSPLGIVHAWSEDGTHRERRVRVPAGARRFEYVIDIPRHATIENEAISFECLPAP